MESKVGLGGVDIGGKITSCISKNGCGVGGGEGFGTPCVPTDVKNSFLEGKMI